jgi:membrane protein required for colicin V production
MNGFTIIDGLVATVVILSAMLAFSRGFVREAMAIAGWVAAALMATLFAPLMVPLVKEIPFIGDFLADSCELSMIASFAVIFAVALVVMSLFTPLLSSLMRNAYLVRIDRGMGFLFGVARGLLIVAVAFFVYNVALTSQSFAALDNSRSAMIFGDLTVKIEERNPEQALGWITGQYEQLVSQCAVSQ